MSEASRPSRWVTLVSIGSARTIAGMTVGGVAVWMLVALWVAVPAPAQSDDPSSGSPSGTIYRLPVDAGRRDAAPRPDGDPSGGGIPGSTFRSDNNFGTSSVVPGDPSGKGDGGGDGSGGG